MVRKGHVEYIDIFVQHVVYRLIVFRRVVFGMALLRIGEETFFIDQIGGFFCGCSSRAGGGTRRSFSRNLFPSGGRRRDWRGVCGFSSGRYQDVLVIAIRWNFVVNQLAVISLGGRDA